jgi:hypothetical protein
LRAVRVKLQVPPLRYPGFPVEVSGAGVLYTAFFRKAAHVDVYEDRMQEIRVRSSRDDKVEGGGTPWHKWTWMDRVEKLIWTIWMKVAQDAAWVGTDSMTSPVGRRTAANHPGPKSW